MKMGMESRFFIAMSSVFFFFVLTLAAQNVPAQVRVGVILSSGSTTGMRWRTGIGMALDDYYAVHPSSATRVELHFRDSAGNAVKAASAAVDLIKNTQVQAIIGPQTSTEAEFVSTIGNQAHVPVLSSAALSPPRTQFFVRTAADESAQGAPVAAILGAFGWRAAALVHEESRHAAGFPQAFADALQGVGARVADRAAVPADATDDRLDAVLYRLMATPTRVFVVHMSSPLAVRLFRRAGNAGMMSDGYAWIATAGVGVNALSDRDIGAMQGVVCVRPYVPATSQTIGFAARFKERFRQENPGSEDNIQEPTAATLWAYDKAWAVAAAAEAAFQPSQGNNTTMAELDRPGVSATGATLLKAVLNATFDGLANGQLQQPAYEIVNVVGKGFTTVGFWTPEFMVSQGPNARSLKGFKQIIWPGQASAPHARVLKQSALSPIEGPLQIAVPVKHGFTQFLQVSNDTITGRQKVTGFCVDVFDEVMKTLQVTNYQYVPFNGSSGSYDELVNQVVQQKYDGVVGDVTITTKRMGEVDFTTPFMGSGWSMVVAVQATTSTSMFFFLQPLTASLWLASFAFFLFTGFVVWVIEHRVNPEFRGTPLQQLGLIFFYAFSTLVFAHRENLVSNFSRFMMIIWLFAVLILTSSYTASLTSMLTIQNLEPTVTDVNELVRRGDYVGYQEGSFLPSALKLMNFDESKLRSYSTADEYADALSKGSANGGVTAIFDEIPYLKLFLSQYCDRYAMVGPTYEDAGFGFIFPTGFSLVTNVSRGIVSLTEGGEMARIERKWFGEPGTCVGQGSSIGGGSSSLSFRNFGGLFLVTGLASGLMLIVYLVRFIYRERHQLRSAEAGGGSMSVRRLRGWMQHYDKKDLRCSTFKYGDDEESGRNGSGARRMQRKDEGVRGGAAAQPGSPDIRSDDASANGREGDEFRSPFEERMEDKNEITVASAEIHGPSVVQRKSSLRILLDSEERKDQSVSP